MFQCESEHKEEPNRFTNWITKHLVTDNEGIIKDLSFPSLTNFGIY